jgi:Flp pilus assembly pilin Flp
MVALRTLFVRLAKEEHGTELIEYALVVGLIVIASVAAMQVMGTAVLARWNFISGASW